MKEESIIKTCITPHFTLIIDNEDGTTKVWKLCYTYKAIAAIEDATGLDIKKYDTWKSISSGKQFPQIVWGGLQKYNPEVTLDEVQDILNPEAQIKLLNVIFELLYPGLVEAYKKLEAEHSTGTGVTANPNAEQIPQDK